MQQFPVAFNGLANYPQFLLFKLIQREGRLDKIPLNPHTLAPHDAHDPAIWLPANDALNIANQHGLGVAFTFTDNDPFFFIDVDDCVDENGNWNQTALSLFQQFPNAACEISSSGRGLHFFGTGVLPPGHRVKFNGFDLFTTKRFVALTGNVINGDCSTNYQQQLNNIIAANPQTNQSPVDFVWTNEPVPEWKGIQDDQQLIERMLATQSAGSVFGGKASIADLWNANADVLGVCFPDDNNRPFDHSAADAALCAHLAFWCGKDCDRIDRLFRMSGLYRAKWNEREDYRIRTVGHAVRNCRKVYGEGKNTTAATPTVDEPKMATQTALREGLQYMTVNDQVRYFDGCVYIQDLHRVFTPEGTILKSEQFKATYGGFIFALDTINDKTTKNAFEAFTESQGARFAKAHTTCFRPENPPGALIHEENRILVNTYVPIHVDATPGDVTPFMNHLALLLPNEGDRAILLAYMAACVQHIGSKFQWCPLLQGAEGNGKTLLLECVKNAVGARYTHYPNPNDVANKFNAWLHRKLFIGIEEIHTRDREEIVDTLKLYITNKSVEFQAKGADQFTGDNRANFMLCSNHKDAIRKDENDRRYAIFYTAQQTKADVIASGMTGEYFRAIYDWLRGGGFGHVTNYLRTYKIPNELNPATLCNRAPETTSTAAAIVASRGGVEQEILECIDEGRQGFAGGWISSTALTTLLEQRRDNKRIPPNKRGEILDRLGYVLHPTLRGGRLTTFSPIDNGKPRLYIQKDHISINLDTPMKVAEAYFKAQGVHHVTTNAAQTVRT